MLCFLLGLCTFYFFHFCFVGIQMFLFENERIDNIFTDIYYEKFTECLNEVLLRYTPKLNAAGKTK